MNANSQRNLESNKRANAHSSGSIRLHPKLGVNPRMTYCPRCGSDGKDLLLLGARNYKTTCGNCGTVNYGTSTVENCGKCQLSLRDGKREELTESERLPSTVPCDACTEEIALHKQVVADGGIYFKCAQCPATGVIKGHTELAKAVRATHGIAAPAPCGIEFETCTEHTVGGTE